MLVCRCSTGHKALLVSLERMCRTEEFAICLLYVIILWLGTRFIRFGWGCHPHCQQCPRPWRWRWQVRLKRQYLSAQLPGVTYQNTAVFVFSAVTSGLAQGRLCLLRNREAEFSFLIDFTLDIIFVCECLHPCVFIWLCTVIMPYVLFISYVT